jgi:hypothetical protein
VKTTDLPQVTDKQYHIMLYRVHLAWAWFELTTLVVIGTTLCDIVCQWLAAGRWSSPGALVSSTNKTDCHDIAKILLKVAYPEKTPDLAQVTDKLYYIIMYWVHLTVIGIRIHNVSSVRAHEKKNWPAASYWQTSSHNVVSSTSRHERDSNSHF